MPVMSVSGARLRSIPAASALLYLEQFGAPLHLMHCRVDAWGAFEDRTTVIGVAALLWRSQERFGAQVAVVPGRRRLGIGGELLDIVIRAASAGGGRILTGWHPSGAGEARFLLASSELLWARRVRSDRADVVALIPPEMTLANGAPR